MEQIKKNRASYQKKYRDKIKDKPKKSYYKSPKRNLSKTMTYRHEGTKYSFLSLAFVNGSNVWCQDIYSSFYIANLDFIDKFQIDSVYQSKQRQIDWFWKKIKREIEEIYPNTLVVFNYSTTFNADYKKGKNGILVDLHLKIEKEEFSNKILVKYKDELTKISLDIKKYILKNLEVN